MEQPLPPNGACLLGSWNLTQYCLFEDVYTEDRYKAPGVDMEPIFDYESFSEDIKHIVRMMDNVIDNTVYPLPAQEKEAKAKRRMGLGITGFANACSFLGMPYGSPASLEFLREVLRTLRDEAYLASIELAKEKGPFHAFSAEGYSTSEFYQTLPEHIQESIHTYGIRNSHLLSIAPTGTISLWAENISSGIEPVFMHSYNRNVYMPNGEVKQFYLEDYAFHEWGLKGETSEEVSVQQHIDVLNVASSMVDSACSKTCNVGDHVSFDEFKELYMMAYEGGSSGCTTFRPASLKEGSTRGAVLEKVKEPEGGSCSINEYGEKSCAD